METWSPVPGYRGEYWVSTEGNVMSTKGNKRLLMKQYMERYGYLRVDLCIDRVRTHWLVHRLVAVTYLPNPNALPDINHKDGVKSNNHLDNLEWTTESDNTIHAYEIGTMKRIPNWVALCVYYGRESTHVLARHFGISQSNVMHIKKKRTFKHLHV